MSGLAIRLDLALGDLLRALPELDAAAIVTIDGLPMASALPPGMHEDRVAAMSAALLSLGERAAEGLGRGALSQVYIEGEQGTVYLLAAGEDAVLVAVASRGAKAGLVLYELRHTAAQLGHELDKACPQFDAAPPAAVAPAAVAPPAVAPPGVAPPAVPPPAVPPASLPGPRDTLSTLPGVGSALPGLSGLDGCGADGAANGAAVSSSAAASPAASVTTTREDTSPVPPATVGRADDGGAEPLPWASFSNSRVWT